MQPRAQRYSTEQVLAGIQAFVREEVDTQLVIDPDASVITYIKAVEESHECPLEFLEELAEYFGFEHSQQRWSVWLRLRPKRLTPAHRRREQTFEQWAAETAPGRTIRRLAEHIARRAPAVSMAPATVFGRECAPAGVFLGLAALPEVRGRRVAPSTPLRSLKSGERLRALWRRAEWVSGVRLPTLTESKRWSLGTPAEWVEAFGVVAGAAAALAIGWWIGAATESWFSGAVVFIVSLLTWLTAAHAAGDRLRNPLPDNVTSFRDLAELIASRPSV